MLAGLEPFRSWHTPIAWTGYILFVDGLVWTLRGSSWLSDARPEFAFLAAVSIPLWVVFELYNLQSLRNWHYVGLPGQAWLRYLGYGWSFATIWPAIFETGDLAAALRARRARRGASRPGPEAAGQGEPSRAAPGTMPLGPSAWAGIAAGALMLLVPILYPSPYLAAPVFLGFIFVLDPLNARAGAESILGDLRRGRPDRLVNLLVAGLVCGVVWEFWNYWAGAKWIYTVPIMPGVRIFEMPLPGYAGFPAFAVECFTMYVAVRRWIWKAPARPISI